MITLLGLTPYTGAMLVPSPNYGPRKAPAIYGIVLHATADGGNEAGTLTWMQSPRSRTSCHLLVGRTGYVTRLVGDHQRAWHAGRASWRGKSDVNSITLGIEIANRNDGEPYTDAQYGRVAEIVAHYCRQGLTLADVVSHGEIAQGRRTDPYGWDWERFRAMVQDQLNATDLEARRELTYDRRSAERLAAEDAAAIPLPSVTPTRPALSPPAPTSIAPAGEGHAATPAKPAVVAIAPKPVLCSRTVWLNGLTVLAAGGVIIGEVLDLAFWIGLNPPQQFTMWILFGLGIVNILLRFQTSCPVGGTPRVTSRLEATVRVPRRTERRAEKRIERRGTAWPRGSRN